MYDAKDAAAMARAVRLTRGNFRLIERLFAQVDRILSINELLTIVIGRTGWGSGTRAAPVTVGSPQAPRRPFSGRNPAFAVLSPRHGDARPVGALSFALEASRT
jgi:hypothetical protein